MKELACHSNLGKIHTGKADTNQPVSKSEPDVRPGVNLFFVMFSQAQWDFFGQLK